jgi:hypothetical protein
LDILLTEAFASCSFFLYLAGRPFHLHFVGQNVRRYRETLSPTTVLD